MGPPGVRSLQTVHGVGSTEFPRLHDKRGETRDQSQQYDRVAKPATERCEHFQRW